jgi:hypothetical protein
MIKKYTKFLESIENYSIYDWYQDLRGDNLTDIKKWSDHFIGGNLYDRIVKKIDDSFIKFENIELLDIETIIIDTYDIAGSDKIREVYYCMLSGNYWDQDRLDKGNIDSKYNGAQLFKVPTQDLRNKILFDILREIVRPTLFISIGKNDYNLRYNKEMSLVLDDKYKCCNFNYNDFEDDFKDKHSHLGLVTWFSSTRIKKYDTELIFDLYQPGLYIRMDHDTTQPYSTIKIHKIEEIIDDRESTILDYLEGCGSKGKLIHDFYHKGKPREAYEYKLRILLE